MKFLIKDKKTGESVIKENYPRGNDSLGKKIEGKNAENIVIYLVDESKPKFDSTKESLQVGEITLTEKKHSEYPHILIAIQNYNVIGKSKKQVIDELNQIFYNHIDIEYPVIERQKDTDELLYGKPDNLRKEMLLAKKEYEQRLRKDKRKRITDYMESDIFPSFEFDNLIL